MSTRLEQRVFSLVAILWFVTAICPISVMTLDLDTFEFQMNLGRLSLQNWQKKIPVNAIPDEIRDNLITLSTVVG